MSGLFGSSIIETAIGLFFLYWLLSVICSAVWEMIAALLKLRAKDLEQGIANLVCDPEIFHQVMSHPAVTVVGNTDAETGLVRFFAGIYGVAGRPSYISAPSFSLAFLDSIAPVTTAGSAFAAVRTRAEKLMEAATSGLALKDLAAQDAAPPTGSRDERIKGQFLTELATLPPSDEKTALTNNLSATDASSLPSALPPIMSGALALPSWHPVRHAAVRALEAATAAELYAWAEAPALKSFDRLKQAIVASVEGKKRLGKFLLNLTDREVQAPERAKLLAQMRGYLGELPAAAAPAIERALNNGDIGRARDLVAQLPDPLRNRILGAIDATNADLTALRTKVESWFDESMEHVSGVYKRRAKTWIFLIGLLITLFAGADSMRFVTTLYGSPTLRDVLVRDAENAVATPAPAAVGAATPTPVPGATPQPATGRLSAQDAAKELAQFSQLFGFADHPELIPAPEPQHDWGAWLAVFVQQPRFWDWVGWITTRILGSVLTAFAVSMGAPFWFDVLGKVVNVRAAGKSTTSSSDSSKAQTESAAATS